MDSDYFNEPMIAAIPEIPPKATSAITKTIAKRMETQKKERAKLLRQILLESHAKIIIQIKPMSGMLKRMLYSKYAHAVSGLYFCGNDIIS